MPVGALSAVDPGLPRAFPGVSPDGQRSASANSFGLCRSISSRLAIVTASVFFPDAVPIARLVGRCLWRRGSVQRPETDHRADHAGGDAVCDLHRLPDLVHAGVSRLRVRHLGGQFQARDLPEDAADQLGDAQRPAGRRALVHFHGHRDGTGGTDGTAVPGGADDDEPDKGRAVHRGPVRVDHLRRGNRDRRGLRHHPRHHGGAHDEQVGLRCPARCRDDHRGRHAGHPDPAVDHADRHGAGPGSAGDRSVPRRDHSRRDAGGALPDSTRSGAAGSTRPRPDPAARRATRDLAVLPLGGHSGDGRAGHPDLAHHQRVDGGVRLSAGRAGRAAGLGGRHARGLQVAGSDQTGRFQFLRPLVRVLHGAGAADGAHRLCTGLDPGWLGDARRSLGLRRVRRGASVGCCTASLRSPGSTTR